MPEIPQFRAGAQLRTGAARIRPAAATAVAEAVGGLGQVISRQAGVAIQRQRDADDAAFVTERTNKLLRQETELLAEAETTGSEVDLENLQANYQSRTEALSEGAPSSEALAEFNLQADNAFTRKFFPSYSRHQSGLNVQKRVRSFESGIDDIQSEVLGGRTPVAEAVARTEAALTGLQETSGGVVDIAQARINAFNEIATNSLGGRIDRGEGRQVISEIKEGKWDKLTDSKTLARILSAAERDIKQRDKAEKQKFVQGFDDYVAFLSTGQEDEGLATRFSPKNINAVMGAEKGPGLFESITDARSFGQAVNEVKTATPDELRALLEKEKPTKAEKFRREAKQFNILGRAIQARNKAIADDPSLYVMQNTPIAARSFESFQEAFNSGDTEATAAAAQEFAAIQRATQQDLGVHPQGVQLLPEQFEDNLIKQLNDFSQGGENVALQIDALKNAFGGEWDTVQRQLHQSGKLTANLKTISAMPFGPEMIKVAEALSIPQKEYKAVLTDDDFKDIKLDVKGELDDFQDTLRGQPGFAGAFKQITAAVESSAMKYIADGDFTSTSEAIEQARSDVIDSRFNFVDTYRVPVEFSPDDVEAGVLDVIDRIQAGEFDLFIPPSDQVLNLEDQREVYLSALKPVPITEPNGTGILFINQNKDAIFKADGDPLIIPWKQLSEFEPGLRLFRPGRI